MFVLLLHIRRKKPGLEATIPAPFFILGIFHLESYNVHWLWRLLQEAAGINNRAKKILLLYGKNLLILERITLSEPGGIPCKAAGRLIVGDKVGD
jgi:hypothetical protein